jgi:hypothetical protein
VIATPLVVAVAAALIIYVPAPPVPVPNETIYAPTGIPVPVTCVPTVIVPAVTAVIVNVVFDAIDAVPVNNKTPVFTPFPPTPAVV